MTRERRRAVVVAAVGVVLVAAYALVMVLQILVWNPLAAAPSGLTLDEIYATMQRAGEWWLGGHVWVISLSSVGVLLAVALLVAAAVVRTPRPLLVAAGVATILAFGAPAYWVASFSMGMSLADTFMIGGADVSPWALPLLGVSALAAAAAFVFAARAGVRREPPLIPSSNLR